MLNKLIPFLQKPLPYAKNTSEFWNDGHISKEMLKAHLEPGKDGATRNAEFVNRSVNWITDTFPPVKYPDLLDLGCGPGIYAEKFSKRGYHVTGVDFSKRSIQYAQKNAEKKFLDIRYIFEDYLKFSYEEQYMVITMIYCDFGVLSDTDRRTLLRKIYQALKPNGTFVFDVFTPAFYKNRQESKTWEYCKTGFFSESPYISLESFYRYDDCNTFLEQYIIITDDDVKCYNLWNHGFTAEEIRNDLQTAGFSNIKMFSDISGKPYEPGSHMICVTAQAGSA